MSEEKIESSSEEILEVEGVSETPEDKAYKQGWRAESEYKGDPDKWVDAKTFIRNGSYLREINKLKVMVDESTKLALTAEKRAYERAMSDLQREREIAHVTGDTKALEQTYQKAAQIQKEYQPALNKLQAPTPETLLDQPVFKEFREKNAWFDATDVKSTIKKKAMQTLGEEYERKNPHLNTLTNDAAMKEELDYIHEQIRLLFPDEQEIMRDKPSKVASSPTMTSKNRGQFAFSKGESEADKIASTLPAAEAQMVRYLDKKGQDWKSYVKLLKKYK